MLRFRWPAVDYDGPKYWQMRLTVQIQTFGEAGSLAPHPRITLWELQNSPCTGDETNMSPFGTVSGGIYCT